VREAAGGTSEQKSHGGAGTKKSDDDGRRYTFKGHGGEAAKGRGGVRGSQPTHGGARGGGVWLPPVGTAQVARHGRQRPGHGVRGRHACPHSGGWHRVADERGPDGNGRVRGREARGAHGPAGDGNGVGRARMNSDDF
jgi:hypothetical protein